MTARPFFDGAGRTGPPTALHAARLDAVAAALRAAGARSVLDLGCGEGALLRRLLAEPAVARLTGLDPDRAALDRARAALAALPEADRARVALHEGSLLSPDPALAGHDAATLVEVIEHLPPDRLSVLERALFETLRPGVVAITTPNADYNPLLGKPAGRPRHPDHRFEWGRARFRAWAEGVARRRGCAVTFEDLGPRHPDLGAPSQMALFRRRI